MLAKSYVDADAHIAAAAAYHKLGNAAQAKFHRDIALGLLRSILASGDGKTPATAWSVVAVYEEY